MFKKTNFILWGNLTYSASQFFILSILVKFGTPYDVGMYMLSLSLVTPVYIFLSFQMRNVLATDSKNSVKLNEVFQIRIFILLLTVILALIFIFIFRNNLFTIISLIALFKAIDAFFDIYFGYYLKNKKNKKMGKMLMLKTIVTSIVFIGMFVICKNLLLALTIQIFVLIIYLGIQLYREQIIKYEGLKIIDKKSINKFLLLTFPLAISGLLISVMPQIPRYIIGYELGIVEVGYFSSISYIIVIGTLFVNTINSAYYSHLTDLIEKKELKSYIKINIKMAITFFIIWIIILFATWAFGRELLVIIFNEEYRGLIEEFKIIALSLIFLFWSTLFINITLYLKKYKIQLLIYGIISLFSITFSIIFISKYDFYGAAIALFLINITQFIVSLIFYIYLIRDVYMKGVSK